MSDNDESWCTIESDPGVFTELIEGVGVKGVQLEELYVLDDDIFEELKPIYGLVFLFKYEGGKDERSITFAPDVFFARQVVPNACATQAILSILLNAKGINLGPTLQEFKEITKDFPPDVKGMAVGNHTLIKKVHNSFARPEPFSIEKDPSLASEDAFHFISYVPVNGTLYELDGLKKGPIALCQCTDDTWLKLVKPHIQKRIETYSKSEIRFNLMGIIKNRKEALQEKLEEHRAKKAELEKKANDDMDLDGDPQLQEICDKIEQTQGSIANEEAKNANWKAENQRRKHNYIPFLFNLLKVLAEKDLLIPLIERAKEKQKQDKDKK